MSMRFLKPQQSARNLKRKASGVTAQQLQLVCRFGRNPSDGQRSDDELEFNDDAAQDVWLPRETLEQDMDLVQEMEMDRDLWQRRFWFLYPVESWQP